MESQELEAYGLCGLTPATFAALTVPEWHSMLEAAYWREARKTKLIAQMIAQLIRPHADNSFQPAFYVDDLLDGDPVEKVEAERAKRLASRRKPPKDERWPL